MALPEAIDAFDTAAIAFEDAVADLVAALNAIPAPADRTGEDVANIDEVRPLLSFALSGVYAALAGIPFNKMDP